MNLKTAINGLLELAGLGENEIVKAQRETADQLARERNERDAGKLDLSRLPTLENELFQLNFRIQDTSEVLASLAPEFDFVERHLKAEREAVGEIEQQIRNLKLQRSSAVIDKLESLRRNVEQTEIQHAELKRRLDGKRRLLESTQDLLREWQKRNAQELQALRTADKLLTGREGGYISNRFGQRGAQPDSYPFAG